jgi:hypothetical protein
MTLSPSSEEQAVQGKTLLGYILEFLQSFELEVGWVKLKQTHFK